MRINTCAPLHRFAIFAALAIAAPALLTGCIVAGGQSDAAIASRGAATGFSGDDGGSPDRALIRQASMQIEVDDPAAAAEEASAIATGFGGDAVSLSTARDERVNLTLRVPEDRLDEALDAFAELGEVTHRRLSSQDVTEQMIDNEARLENLTATRDRLRRHLDQATSVQDIIAVERELARVQSEIDSLAGRLAHLRSSVALSTVSLTIERRTVLGPLGWVVWAVG